MGQNNAGLLGCFGAIARPAFDQIGPCSVAGFRSMDHAMVAVGIERFAGAPATELACGLLLPALTLTADLADLDMAVLFREGPKRRAGLDRLQLLGSPTRTTLALHRSASPSTRSNLREPIMPASSITNTSWAPRSSRPCAQIDHTRTLADEARAHAMQSQQIHLLWRLDRHEVHGRPLHGFRNRLGIAVVVLVTLEERLHVLRRDQTHIVADRCKLPTDGNRFSAPTLMLARGMSQASR